MADEARPSILFVTRKYPPMIGGMETLAASTWRALQRQPVRSDLVALRGRQWWLPLWVPYAVLRVIGAVMRDRATVVLCGDALIHALLWPVLTIIGARHSTMVMGLDLTWAFKPYQWWIRQTLPSADRVIAISAATADVARTLGTSPDRVAVLRLAVPVPDVTPEARTAARRALVERFGVEEGTVLMVAISRLVRRKGMRWFVEQVMPRLPQTTLLVAGTGPEKDEITKAIREHDLAEEVHLLGAVDDATRELLMQGADVFVQPNIPVPQDMEGFGLVAVEAASRGALVVAADLEGLKDAVINGATGLLLPPGDAAAWADTIAGLAGAPAAREALAEEYMTACRREFDPDAMGAELRRLVFSADA
jgi:phosphatidylinositol alpha-1,6-mannosyltransferase